VLWYAYLLVCFTGVRSVVIVLSSVNTYEGKCKPKYLNPKPDDFSVEDMACLSIVASYKLAMACTSAFLGGAVLSEGAWGKDQNSTN